MAVKQYICLAIYNSPPARFILWTS